MDPEPTDPPIAGRKDLIVNVEEQNTGNFTLGAGFSSVDALVGFVEVTQGNFDLFHPPTFTGGGQKCGCASSWARSGRTMKFHSPSRGF
jgi:outer membrane protein insertion porin family